MQQQIPTLTIKKLVDQPTYQKTDGDCYYAVESGAVLTPSFPHRTSFYGMGLVLKGTIQLQANLHRYTTDENSLILMPPQVIRCWQKRSNDYDVDAVFFTRAFLHQGQVFPPGFLERFPFFSSTATYCFPVKESEADHVRQHLQFIQRIAAADHPGKETIIRHSIGILLELAAAIYPEAPATEATTRGTALTNQFKALVCEHAVALRMVAHYADMLNVSPKYLTKVVKNSTGKTPGEIIDEMVTLEAQVMLADTKKNVAEVAEALQFPDASTFGKYFKKHAGFSPQAYRNNLGNSGPPQATN